MSDPKITPEVRARLAMLENEHGQITPAMVVEDAKQKDSPLHGLFDWNVKSAAMKYWIHQARTIIHSVRLVSSLVETVTLKTPHYVRDPSVPRGEQGYVSVAQLQKDPERARESLRIEFSRAEGALTRARALAAALDLEEEVELLLMGVSGLRQQMELTPEESQPAA